jgi:hypothetical protein
MAAGPTQKDSGFFKLIILFIGFKDKGASVFAVFAHIDLPHISSGYRKYIRALADRTVVHIQQLYMSIRHKN